MVKAVFLRFYLVWGVEEGLMGQIAARVSHTGGWRGRHTLVEIPTRRRITQTAAYSTTGELTTFLAGGTIWQRASGGPAFLSCGWWDDCQQVGWPPRCQEAGSRAHTNTHREQTLGKQEKTGNKWATQGTCGRKATVGCTCSWCQLCFVIPPAKCNDSLLFPLWQQGRKPGMEPHRRCDGTHGLRTLCFFITSLLWVRPSEATLQLSIVRKQWCLKCDKTDAASAALLRLPHQSQSSLCPVWKLLLLWRL